MFYMLIAEFLLDIFLRAKHLLNPFVIRCKLLFTLTYKQQLNNNNTGPTFQVSEFHTSNPLIL